MSKVGVMICGHGSRDVNAVDEFDAVARGLRERLPRYQVESGFLEFATPIIRDGLDRLHEAGHDLVLAVPGMLFAAGHAKNDIPSVLRTYEAGNPGMEIRYARELGIDPKMLKAAGDRIRQALDRANDGVPLHDTMLVVVGRGTSDSDANSNINKIMRMLWEGFGFGWGEVCYSGVTFPLVEPGLRHAAKLGYRRIVVFPYFLFTGILVKRIYAHTDRVAAQHPEIEFVKAGYLNDHPHGARCLHRSGGRDSERREQHELQALQVPRADSRIRGRSGPAAGEPSSPRGGDRDRWPRAFTRSFQRRRPPSPSPRARTRAPSRSGSSPRTPPVSARRPPARPAEHDRRVTERLTTGLTGRRETGVRGAD